MRKPEVEFVQELLKQYPYWFYDPHEQIKLPIYAAFLTNSDQSINVKEPHRDGAIG